MIPDGPWSIPVGNKYLMHDNRKGMIWADDEFLTVFSVRT